MRHKAPLFFLLGLTLLLIFIVGVRYGQHVEKSNKQNVVNLTAAPARISPTLQPKQLTFKTYTHKGCRTEFLYPDTLVKTKETSTSARFEDIVEPAETAGIVKLAVSCDPRDPFAQAVAQDKNATSVARFNIFTGRQNYFFATLDLLPLLESSLKFK